MESFLNNSVLHWDLATLTDHILNEHHKYVRHSIPIIYEYTQKIARIHGERHPEVIAIAEKFIILTDELNRHICKEEEILFPYIMHLATACNYGMKIEPSPFGTVEIPINTMEQEHDTVGTIMEEIKKLSDNFSPPDDACATYKLSYLKLKEFDNDLQQHVYLESKILFPKAIELEKLLN